MCSKEIKCAAYYTLVKPQLEYASVAWVHTLKLKRNQLSECKRKQPDL